MGALLGLVLRKAAEGDFGPVVARVYWSLVGAKTLIAVILAFVGGIVRVAVDSGLCGYLGWMDQCGVVAGAVSQAALYVAAAMAVLGQVDGAVRLTPPKTK